MNYCYVINGLDNTGKNRFINECARKTKAKIPESQTFTVFLWDVEELMFLIKIRHLKSENDVQAKILDLRKTGGWKEKGSMGILEAVLLGYLYPFTYQHLVILQIPIYFPNFLPTLQFQHLQCISKTVKKVFYCVYICLNEYYCMFIHFEIRYGQRKFFREGRFRAFFLRKILSTHFWSQWDVVIQFLCLLKKIFQKKSQLSGTVQVLSNIFT